jgi:hypothetical protein
MKQIIARLRVVAAGLLLTSAFTGRAGTITIESDLNTTGYEVPLNDPTIFNGDVSGLTPVTVQGDSSGTFTAPPSGAPLTALTINLPFDPSYAQVPISGYSQTWPSGLFEVSFNLPAGFSGANLSGAGNVDDEGGAFLNGVLVSSSTTALSESGNVTFGTTDDSLFHAGLNTLVISDNNSGYGPSGVAFYATVNYNTVPEGGNVYMLPCFALTCFAMAAYRRRVLA